MEPLRLDSRASGLDAARAALAPAALRPLPVWVALVCAGLMAASALAAAGVVLLGGWEPTRAEAGAVRERLGG